MKRIFLVVVGILVIGFVIYFFGRKQVKQFINTSPISSLSQATPTPFPFKELTIPYLRQKTYSSTLGPREEISSNGSYTSYLTSFTSDGFKVNGLLTIPTGDPTAGSGQVKPASGWPAIIFIHGYIPPAQYQTLTQYADYVDYLARNGFVVFKIDLRGHGDSEGEAGGGYYGGDYVTDALNAYSALQNSDVVNPNGIGLWGHSMAGNIVLRSLVTKPEIPGGVIWAGAVYTYTDMQKYGISDSSYSPPANNVARLNRRRELFEKHGSPSAQSNFWQEVAPTTYLEDLKGAVEIHHAINDNVVNIGYSRDLISLLDKTSVPHELFEYQSGGHNISGTSFNEAMQRTVEFFKKYLK